MWFRLRQRFKSFCCLVVVALLVLPLTSRASLIDLTPKNGPTPVTHGNPEFTQEGKFELAKVRILGVPVINEPT